MHSKWTIGKKNSETENHFWKNKGTIRRIIYLCIYLFICNLLVICLKTLLVFGITKHRIGGWMAVEKGCIIIQGNFQPFSYKIWENHTTCWNSQYLKENLETKNFEAKKKKKEKWENPKTSKEASRDDIKVRLYITKNTPFYSKHFVLKFGTSRWVPKRSVIIKHNCAAGN